MWIFSKDTKMVFRKMQIKTTMRCYLSSVRMAIIKGPEVSAGEAMEKGDPCTMLVGISRN
jgi:hypothetical protein